MLSADATAESTTRLLPGTATIDAGPTSEPTAELISQTAFQQPPVRPTGEPPRPRITTPVESARAEAVPPAAAPRSWRVGLDGGLAFGVGLLPKPSLGATASVFVQVGGGTKIFAAASAWSQQTSAVGAGQGVMLSLASLGLEVCPLNGGWHAFTWRACAGGDVSLLQALGFGFTLSTGQERLTADVATAVEVQRRLVGPLYTGVPAELVVPLIRDRIAYSGSSCRFSGPGRWPESVRCASVAFSK